ncbi:MAG: hypothetical protein M3458_05185 [Acidobacteriota bacterium]|nr:hypothetical protein [Acidobacteriota bacterium]
MNHRRKKTVPFLQLMALLWACVFATVVAAGPAQEAAKPGEITTAYDQSSDTTKVMLQPTIIISRKREELRLGAVSVHHGRVIAKPNKVALVFVSLSVEGGNRYESARKLTIVADGRRFALGETQRTMQSGNGVFIESMTAVVPYEIFSQTAYAKKVSVKLGLTEFELNSDHTKMLRAAASYMTQ